MSEAVTLFIAFFVSEVSAISEVSAVCGAKSFRKALERGTSSTRMTVILGLPLLLQTTGIMAKIGKIPKQCPSSTENN